MCAQSRKKPGPSSAFGIRQKGNPAGRFRSAKCPSCCGKTSGKKKKVTCFEESNLNDLYNFFNSSSYEILNGDFEEAVRNAKKGDFVYFDPPYDTWDDKNSFTSYAKNPFGKDEQVRLSNVYKALSNKGVYVMLSNHNTDFIRELYKDFNIHIVEAKRMINSKADGRGNVEEVIITNYE